MRQFLPDGYVYDENKAHPVTFTNPDGNKLEIWLLASNVVRVKHTLHSKRQDIHNNNDKDSSTASFSIKQQDPNQMEIETPELRIVIELPSLRLIWYDKSQREPFAEDLPKRAYAYDKNSHDVSDVWHYRKRYDDDAFYGLGERTGSLNLAGRRFRLERLDSMGYDAETQDPLYKFSPFYVTLSKATGRAHGIYYQNFSTTTVDLGQELDAVSAYTPIYRLGLQMRVVDVGEIYLLSCTNRSLGLCHYLWPICVGGNTIVRYLDGRTATLATALFLRLSCVFYGLR